MWKSERRPYIAEPHLLFNAKENVKQLTISKTLASLHRQHPGLANPVTMLDLVVALLQDKEEGQQIHVV